MPRARGQLALGWQPDADRQPSVEHQQTDPAGQGDVRRLTGRRPRPEQAGELPWSDPSRRHAGHRRSLMRATLSRLAMEGKANTCQAALVTYRLRPDDANRVPGDAADPGSTSEAPADPDVTAGPVAPGVGALGRGPPRGAAPDQARRPALRRAGHLRREHGAVRPQRPGQHAVGRVPPGPGRPVRLAPSAAGPSRSVRWCCCCGSRCANGRAWARSATSSSSASSSTSP